MAFLCIDATRGGRYRHHIVSSNIAHVLYTFLEDRSETLLETFYFGLPLVVAITGEAHHAAMNP